MGISRSWSFTERDTAKEVRRMGADGGFTKVSCRTEEEKVSPATRRRASFTIPMNSAATSIVKKGEMTAHLPCTKRCKSINIIV